MEETTENSDELRVDSLDRIDGDISAIRTYVDTHHPVIYLLTPCYGGMCHVNYTIGLMNTVEVCRHLQIGLKIEFCRNDSLITRARNNLVAKAMNDPTMTHIMFIDNDITWEPIDIIKLMMAEKPVIGGTYPLKKYNWDRLLNVPDSVATMLARKAKSQLKDMLTDEEMVRCNLVNYNINYLSTHLKVDNNVAEVQHLATGFMMIQRTTLETMFQAFPETKYMDDVNFLSPEENKYAYALFDCRVENGHYFSEDWYFCHRWSKLGGSIFLNVSVNLTHTGAEDYSGSYLASVI